MRNGQEFFRGGVFVLLATLALLLVLAVTGVLLRPEGGGVIPALAIGGMVGGGLMLGGIYIFMSSTRKGAKDLLTLAEDTRNLHGLR